MEPRSAKAVANYFLKKYGHTGITPLKMQKLVYIAHGWNLAVNDEPLVTDERVEAWDYGPIYASLYHEFKYLGRLPIIDLAEDVGQDMKKFTPKIDRGDKKTMQLLDRVWEVYGGMSEMALSAICHQPDSPWAETKDVLPGIRNAHISEDAIKNHYKAKVERNRSIRKAVQTA